MFSKHILEQAIKDGWIQVQKHPEYPWYIYNYTQKTQYEKHWNELTLSCRGLILNENYEIVARPLPKFFNWEELNDDKIPKLGFEVFEKLDGSLGILYWVDNKPYIATRGSFNSLQAKKANELLYTKYKNLIKNLNTRNTYLFEIIYPENRIVVNYGSREELVLLAIIETSTGKELSMDDIGFPRAKRIFGINTIEDISKHYDLLNEGFVIKFSNGFRIKAKFPEYIRLHKIITEVSSISLWEDLKNGKSLEDLLKNIPDEIFQWVKEKRTQLTEHYLEIENQCKKDFKILNSRKETASYFLTCSYPKILFSMLDRRDYSPIIWKIIKPDFEKPLTSKF